MSETELEMAERHVALGERHIARQYEIIAELTEHGHATEQAKRLLDNLLDIQVQHVAHRDRLLSSN